MGMVTMQNDEFETEEPTQEYTPLQWSDDERAWMALGAERSARKAS